MRRDDARREARREVRRARWEAIRRAGYGGNDAHLDRWSFRCALLCDGCGFLGWPDDPTAGDPQRRQPSETRRCPHCDGQTWIDLQYQPIAEALQETEAYDVRTRRWFALRVAASLAIVAAAASVSFAAATLHPIFGCVVGCLAFAGVCVAANLLEPELPSRRKLPRRWSMTLRPRGRTRPAASGSVVADAELVAPLSGRACVAYEVGVRHDTHRSGALRTWALLEQRNAPFEVAGTRVRADGTHLALRRELHRPREVDLPRVHDYLRARGIDPHARDLVLYETIVTKNAGVHLHTGGGGTPVLHAS